MSRKAKAAVRLEDDAKQMAEERARHDEFVARKQREHKRAMDLSDAITTYLRNAYDPEPLRAWFLADYSSAEYEVANFIQLHFDEFECLPDAAKYPILIGLYARMLNNVNFARNLKMIDRPPLPTFKAICEKADAQ